MVMTSITPIRAAIAVLALMAMAGGLVLLAGGRPPSAALKNEAILLPEGTSAGGRRLVRFASHPYRIDRIYESMQGPSGVQSGLPIGLDSDVIWVTATHSRVVDAQTLDPIEQEFFCHSNLEVRAAPGAAEAREKIFGADREAMDSRLFTLVPGRLGIRLPEGFAVPVMPGEQVFYQSMVLNLNTPQIDRWIRVLTEVEVVGPEEADKVRPLYRRALYALQEFDPSAPAVMTPEQAEECGCGPGQSISASAASVLPRFGGNKTLHWYVPPGRHEYVEDVTEQLGLEFDTRIHYATVHLHPTGQWVELRDVTAGTTVLRLASRDLQGRRGVEHVEEIGSAEGIPLIAGHKYELVTVYDNTSDKPVDAMSILYLYLAGRSDHAAGV